MVMQYEKERIPNFNSVSTLIDRICIENVKKSIFELRASEEGSTTAYSTKIKVQDRIIRELKEEFTDLMVKSWITSEYDVIDETRTF